MIDIDSCEGRSWRMLTNSFDSAKKKPYGLATYVGWQRQLRIGELADWTGSDPATGGDST